jgi:hypothetical protein
MAVDFDALLHRPLFEIFGVAATYTASGGGAQVACAVILDTRDRELEFGRGPAVMQGQILQVRRSELPAPAKGGTFAVGSATLTVLDDPRSDDPDRNVWRMTVR